MFNSLKKYLKKQKLKKIKECILFDLELNKNNKNISENLRAIKSWEKLKQLHLVNEQLKDL